MSDLIRDAPIGQLIRYLTKNRVLQYPEEKADFKCPHCYSGDGESKESAPVIEKPPAARTTDQSAVQRPESIERDDDSSSSTSESVQYEDVVKVETVKTNTGDSNIAKISSRVALEKSKSLHDLETAMTQATLEKGPTRPIEPETLADGTILVDWYDTDDPENPQNWSFGKKMFVLTQICVYTTAVYMGSSIYSSSEEGVAARFNVSLLAASLGLSMYVLAYGLGPMLWSPLSEIPVIGRNPPYMITYAIFVILCVPTALVENFAGLLVLRFLQGFFGSPCLATGGASLQDMFSLIKVPYVLCLWAFAATCGPAFGPIISGFSVTAENWRWSLWEMLWLSGPVWIVMFLFLPETYSPNILLRRARRLRALTGNTKLRSQSEIDQGNTSVTHLILENLWRPNQIMLLDPAVGFTALYTALIYGIYYSFFEGFPLVYIEGYGFNLGEMGLTFLSITVGVVIAILVYFAYLWWYVEPRIRKYGLGTPEQRLVPALIASFLLPIGLFWFGWTGRPSIPWIVPTLGILVFTIGIMIVMQCIFIYLAFSYPQYAASLFAGNDFTRSTLAAGAILFSRPLYGNLGVARGSSLLGGLTAGCVAGVWALWYYGGWLRSRSRFAAS